MEVGFLEESPKETLITGVPHLTNPHGGFSKKLGFLLVSLCGQKGPPNLEKRPHGDMRSGQSFRGSGEELSIQSLMPVLLEGSFVSPCEGKPKRTATQFWGAPHFETRP